MITELLITLLYEEVMIRWLTKVDKAMKGACDERDGRDGCERLFFYRTKTRVKERICVCAMNLC